MLTLAQLLETISWQKTAEQQPEVFEKFNNISDILLNSLVSPQLVKSPEAGMVIRYLGPTKFLDKIDQLLIFLQDMNWPAADYVAEVLSLMGEHLVIPVKKIFNESNDSLWQYWILIGVIRNLELNIQNLFQKELLSIIDRGDTEGASLEALKILKPSLNQIEFKNKYDHLFHLYTINKAEDLLEELYELNLQE